MTCVTFTLASRPCSICQIGSGPIPLIFPLVRNRVLNFHPFTPSVIPWGRLYIRPQTFRHASNSNFPHSSSFAPSCKFRVLPPKFRLCLPSHSRSTLSTSVPPPIPHKSTRTRIRLLPCVANTVLLKYRRVASRQPSICPVLTAYLCVVGVGLPVDISHNRDQTLMRRNRRCYPHVLVKGSSLVVPFSMCFFPSLSHPLHRDIWGSRNTARPGSGSKKGHRCVL